MGAALVTARDETGAAGREFFERLHNVPAFGFGRVRLRTNQHEIVVHHRKALDGNTIGHHLFFGRRVVHKQHVGIAAPPHVQRLAGTQSDHFHIHPGGFFKRR